MLHERTFWVFFLVFSPVALSLSPGSEISEGGCDLSLTQPCRSNISLCVPLEHVDDGVIDCPDGSDEDCPAGWFICGDFSACIDPSYYQDGVVDCQDESDEACEEWQHECLCGSPRCIDGSKVGDGILDCIEGSDELAIEKETYICPRFQEHEQEILRKKRRAFENQAHGKPNQGGITNFYSVSSGASPPLGVLTSTVFSFVNKGTTSEYLTHVRGTHLDGSYAQVTSLSSRTFFALPTRIKENQVNGLVSSFMRTTVSDGYTKTIVSRIYHTSIDGTYAQLVETETKGVEPTSVNYVTILQGEELHGTFLSHPENSLATLQFSHLEGSLNPAPVAEEIVTVTGTYGKFIRDGLDKETTYSVFTGSYVKDHKTYIFFFGNSALPHQASIKSNQLNQGSENRKVILDMDKDMEVIMPSALKMANTESKNDFLIGEGMVDGHKMDGLFIADSEGIDVKGAHKKDGGDIKMLTVTIGQPSTVVADNFGLTSNSIKEENNIGDVNNLVGNEENNEIDSTVSRGRKAIITGDEIIADIEHINPTPTRPLPAELPTFVIEEPNQNIGDILLREKIRNNNTPKTLLSLENDNLDDNIKAKFEKLNIGEFPLGDSSLPTVTYYGFAEFTTTIADTVVVFSPNSVDNSFPVTKSSSASSDLKGRVVPSSTTSPEKVETSVSPTHDYSTVTTKIFNTIDLYPSGLVSSIGGTVVNDDMTTLFTTLVYGTYIQGQYAQVVRSTSSIFYLVPKSSVPSLSPTSSQETFLTKTLPDLDNNFVDSSPDVGSKDDINLFDSLLSSFQVDNAIGRSVDGNSGQNLNKVEKEITDKDDVGHELPFLPENVSTSPEAIVTPPVPEITTNNYETEFTLTTPLSKTAELANEEELMEGKVNESLSSEPTSSSISDLFFNILETDQSLPFDHEPVDIVTEQSDFESTTELVYDDATEAPGFSLESSLNPENEINAVYFPRTYYTTYTYFTTYHRLNTSSVVSSLETITNIITDDKDLEEYKSLTPSIPTYPVTYWTTYTYWTTLVKDNSSITTSSKKTVSSVVNLTATQAAPVETASSIQPTEVRSLEPKTQDVTTYYTTYTYYTTATIDGSTVISSRLETDSSVVTGGVPLQTLTAESSQEPFGLLFDFPAPTSEAQPTSTLPQSTSTDATIDPFGLIFDLRPDTNSDTESSTGSTEQPNIFSSLLETTTEDLNVKEDPVQIVPEVSDIPSKTGLLSTIRRSTVNDGITTVLSTNIYGTYVDGLYMQLKSTTSEILDKTHSENIVKPTGVLTVNAGSIIEHGITTHYTTQHVGKMVDGKYTMELLSTSKTESIAKDAASDSNPTKTGRVKEIIGSIIHGTKTTYYHSSILGTVIGGIYAQKVESTSRFVSGPSISFNILTDSPATIPSPPITSVPILETSLQETINPTPVIVATESLNLNTTEEPKEVTEISEANKQKNRLSFPIRTSSKRRTDVFPFIRRTSTFRKEDALSKVLAAPPNPIKEEKTTSSPKPEPTTKATKEKLKRTFRFGSLNSPPRKFRFSGKLGSKKDAEEKPDKKKVLALAKPKENKPTQAPKPKEEESDPNDAFRKFRFLDKSSSTGTRSSLPIPRRQRPSSSDAKKKTSNRFRFGFLQETTSKKEEIATTTTTTTTEAPTARSKRPNPFAFLGRPLNEKRRKVSPRKPEPVRNIPTRRPISTTQQPVQKPANPRSRLFSRRRPIIPRFRKQESELNPVILLPDGSNPNLEPEDIDLISFGPEDAVDSFIFKRKRRQAPNFGSRKTSRGIRRFVRQRQEDTTNNDQDKISPSPSIPQKSKEPFTISNPRSLRSRLRSRPDRESPKPKKSTHSRGTIPRRSKSRNTLPFRPRNNPRTTNPRQSFRRPSTDNQLKISNRFRPRTSNKNNNNNNNAEKPTNSRRNSFKSRNRQQARQPPSDKNPIKSFLARPKPPPQHTPDILPSDDGKFEIVTELTVTREVPVTTTIPLIENGNTIEKKVITASLLTETIKPEEITQTEINGEVKFLLSTTVSKQKVTQIFIQPIPTTLVTYTSTFVNGVRSSAAHTLPHTMYSVVTVTAPATENDVQDLLKLLILQQQQQNPFLAALGLNRPSTQLETKTVVTTVTSLTSTEIPIIFRGKPIRTTVVETNTEVITTTEVITKTLGPNESPANPLANPSPFGGLLPLLLQNQLNRKAREINPKELNEMKEKLIDQTLKINPSSLDADLGTEKIHHGPIDILPTFINTEENSNVLPTPPLQSTKNEGQSQSKPFLWRGPAEFTPLKRKVRSAQRGNFRRQRVPSRSLRGRKINENNKIQEISLDATERNQNIVNRENIRVQNLNLANSPATYFTTFTYYTTYLDELNRKIVKSSEETITQVATFGGNILLDDFTKTVPSTVKKDSDVKSMTVQEKFTIKDAIIPGQPRPVPDPVFKDPDPPHGPVIRHEETNKVRSGRRKPTTLRRRPNHIRGNRRRQDGSDITPPTDSSISESNKEEVIVNNAQENEVRTRKIIKTPSNKRRRIRITVTKKRPVKASSSEDVLDKAVVDAGDRQRVVITRRIPQAQDTAVASPLDPFQGSVSQLYTVYSYLYSIYEQNTPVSYSTKVITVSNLIQPTVLKVAEKHQSLPVTSNFYTYEQGKKIASLDDRIRDGYTTKIQLSSATLISIPPRPIEKFENDPPPVVQGNNIFNLQSSIQVARSDPPFGILPIEELDTPEAKIDVLTENENVPSKPVQDAFENDEKDGSPPLRDTLTGGSRRTEDIFRRRPTNSQFRNIHERRNRHRQETNFKNNEQHLPLPIFDEVEPTTEPQITKVNSNIFSIFDEITESPPTSINLPIFGEGKGRPSSPELSEDIAEGNVVQDPVGIPPQLNIFDSLFDEITENPLSSSEPLATDIPIRSTTSPIKSGDSKPKRPSFRRDDIPLIRRNKENISGLQSTVHRLRVTDATTKQGDHTFYNKLNDLDSNAPLTQKHDSGNQNLFGNLLSLHDTINHSLVSTSPLPTPKPESLNLNIDRTINEFLSYDYSDYSDDYYIANDYEVDPKIESSVTITPERSSSLLSSVSRPVLDIFGIFERTNELKPTLISEYNLSETSVPSPTLSVDGESYVTFTTSTLLPILGGEQSMTLTLVTSTLARSFESQLSPLESNGLSLAKSTALPTARTFPTKSQELDTGTLSSDFSVLSNQIFTEETSNPFLLQETTNEGGRAVFGGTKFEQLLPSSEPVGVQLSIDPRQNLATKVMDNGVEVIVAGDKTMTKGNQFTDIIKPSLRNPDRPITLPPSTLSNQMHLLGSPLGSGDPALGLPEKGLEQIFHYKTYFTTLTYYNTILQNGQPVVRTSQETISNVVSAPIYVSGNFVERTKINLDTSTYVATQTFTRVIGDEVNPQVETSEEVITQIVVTEVPTVSRSKIDVTPAFSTVVTKTYLTTYTYYKTYDDGSIETETVVSSDVVTEASVAPVDKSLPVVSLTKSPDKMPAVDSSHKLYATKTYYTTSTYLTTILEGSNTVTSSRTEVTSNVVTEPITSVINTDELFSFGTTVAPEQGLKEDQFENVHYNSIGENLYEELKTLYATFTHYTTLHNGRVKTNELTRTQVLSSTISTTALPFDILLKSQNPISSSQTTEEPLVTGIISSGDFNGSTVQLDPSYIDSSTSQIHGSLHESATDSIESSSFLKTVVQESEEVHSGTFIIKKFITEETPLPKPDDASSIDVIPSSDQLEYSESPATDSSTSTLETSPETVTTPPSFIFDDVVSKIIEPTVQTEVKSSTLTLTDILGTEILHSDGLSNDDKIDEEISEVSLSEKPSPLDQSVADQILSMTSSVDKNTPSGAEDEVSSPTRPEQEAIPEKEESGFGIGLTPMLSAVAGLIGNTFTGKLAGARDAVATRRKINQPLLPKSAIVATDKQSPFIPVGGLGASISSSKDSSIQPEHGFIPLVRPEEENTERKSQSDDHIPIRQISHDINSEPKFPTSLERFGPTFKPPQMTESGFTAMTANIDPTKVSVISGEETIFFGDFNSLNLPPPGQPKINGNPDNLEVAESSPVHIVLKDSNKISPHLLMPNVETQNLPPNENEQLYFNPSTAPTIVDIDAYYAERNDENFNNAASIVDENYNDHLLPTGSELADNSDSNLGSFVNVFPLHDNEDELKSPSIQNPTYLNLEDTELYGGFLPNQPQPDYAVEYYDVYDSNDTNDDVYYYPEPEEAPSVILSTRTRFNFVDGFPIPVTEVITKTSSYVAPAATVVPSPTIKSSDSMVSKEDTLSSQVITPITPKVKTLTTTAEPEIPSHDEDLHDDATLYKDQTDYPEAIDSTKSKISTEKAIESSDAVQYAETNNLDYYVSGPPRTDVCLQTCAINEVCKIFRQEQVCICKPGYSRRVPSDECKKSESYQVALMLERLSDNTLSFVEELKNKSHPNTQFLIKEINSGIEKAMVNSNLGHKYHSSSILEFDDAKDGEQPALVAKVKIDIENKDGDQVMSGSILPFNTIASETAVQEALESSIKQSNYSLGGGEVYAAKEPSMVLAATDFDECLFDEHNDCHKDAKCINLVGTFMCECNEGFRDIFTEENRSPGRECVESKSCSFCNYHGICQASADRETICVCDEWFSGSQCEINMKVILIVGISIAVFMLLLFVIFIAFCCCRTKRDNQSILLRGSSHGKPSTLDRRAIMTRDSSSSESSEDQPRIHPRSMIDDNLPPMPRTPRADYSLGRRSGISCASKDRSVGVHTAIPHVLIPRVKGYNTSSRNYTLERNPETNEESYNGRNLKEEALVKVLEGPPRHSISQEAEKRSRGSVLSVQTLERDVSRTRSRENLDEEHLHRSHRYLHSSREDEDGPVVTKSRSRSGSRPRDLQASTYRSNSIDRIDAHDSIHELASEVEVNSYRYGGRTVSQARSYDETTVRPPIKTLRGESFRSREVTSQVLSDGPPTNAERDGNSTIVYPQMQLYKPLREADSYSDLASHQKPSWE